MRIVCEADAGSLTFSFRGVTSADIPFDASYGYVEELLEAMDTVADVEVSILDGAEAVCGQAQEVVTEVEFLQDFGNLPAALVRCGSRLPCRGVSLRAGGMWRDRERDMVYDAWLEVPDHFVCALSSCLCFHVRQYFSERQHAHVYASAE